MNTVFIINIIILKSYIEFSKNKFFFVIAIFENYNDYHKYGKFKQHKGFKFYNVIYIIFANSFNPGIFEIFWIIHFPRFYNKMLQFLNKNKYYPEKAHFLFKIIAMINDFFVLGSWFQLQAYNYAH